MFSGIIEEAAVVVELEKKKTTFILP